MKSAEEYYRDIEPLIKNGWHQAAISAFEQLLKNHPTFARGHYELGTLHFELGAKERVLECYLKAVEYDSDSIEYLKCLADFYHAEMGQIEPALGIYKKIIERGAADAESLFIAANLCVALHNFEDAVKYYSKVLEVEPWHSEAFEYLEKIKSHQTMAVQAASPEKRYQQSQEAGAAGNVKSAVSILEQIVGQYPDMAIAHNDLGVYYQKLGKEEQSLRHFEQAVQFEPSNNTFKKNLADFYYVVNGNVVDALKIYLNVLELDPEDTEVLMAAGHISMSVGKPDNAIVFFSRVLEIEPWNPAASEALDKIQQDLTGKTAAGF